jgi:adenylylsulfate kinase-like enzyme
MASNDPIPVLWLCGPAGVGKTTAGWEMFEQLTRAGTEPGYVDIDQLGICYPEPPDDPGRHRMKARNLDAVVATFQATGARCAIVSGVVDTKRGVHKDLIPHAEVTVCRLRTDSAELRKRYTGRNSMLELLTETLAAADELDASGFTDVCVDTTGLRTAEVVEQLRTRLNGWPGQPSPSAEATVPTQDSGDGPVLWVCGATGVGKSMAAYEVYLTVRRTGRMAAYVDLDQLGFRTPTPKDNHQVKAANVAALWRTYRAAGAECLIMSGPADDEKTTRTYQDALPRATVTVCRLDAEREELTKRIMSRRTGGGWPQPGDPLTGKSEKHLARIVNQATTEAKSLTQNNTGDLSIDTNNRTIQEIAESIVRKTNFPQ